MVTSLNDAHLDAVFTALADPIRRAMLDRLSSGDRTVGELAAPFDVSRPAISKHLDMLERAGLVHRVPDGRVNRCLFDGAPLHDAMALMQRYRVHWESQLGALTRYLEEDVG